MASEATGAGGLAERYALALYELADSRLGWPLSDYSFNGPEEILTEVYAKAGANDHYKCSFYPGPHKFDRPMQEEAFAWFDRWLKA